MLDAGHPVWAWWQHKCGPGQGIFCQAGSTKPSCKLFFLLSYLCWPANYIKHQSNAYIISIIHTHLNPNLQLSLQASIDFMAFSLPVRVRDGSDSTKDLLGESLANVGFGVPSFRFRGRGSETICCECVVSVGWVLGWVCWSATGPVSLSDWFGSEITNFERICI